jgi:hypothetical protein
VSVVTSNVVDRQKAEDELVPITFLVQRKRLPALRSAVDEISTIVGGRLEGNLPYPRAQALTDAAIALGALRKATKPLSNYSEWYER